MAAGRRPVIPKGVRELGITLTGKGTEVDDRMKTNLPYIFACGDVNGRTPLFHAAVRQSWCARTRLWAEKFHLTKWILNRSRQRCLPCLQLLMSA